MKQIIKAFSLSIAAIALFSCEKEAPVQNGPVEENVKTVQFSTAPVTKTVFGTASGSTLPTLWTANHAVSISLNLTSSKKSSIPVVDEGGATANFQAEIEDDNTGSYNFYAISPYDAVVGVSSGYKSINVNFPTAQTPTATSPDELAQILYGEYAAGSTFPTSATMEFKHLSAYGKISFSNLSLAEGESIVSVSLTASEDWAGRYYYYAEDHDTFSKGDFAANSASKTITIHTTSSSDIWFGCAPVDLGGKTVDVVITTNTGSTYSKTITIPAGKAFTSGKVNAFTINMNGITSDNAVVYTLVENVADLSADSKVIIVAADADVAISTTQNGNNRGQAAITKSGNTISSPGADVQIFTLKAGTASGTWAFYTGTGYIYAASSEKNYLRTEETLSGNSSWEITISGSATSVVAAGTNTHNTLQYNSGNSLFSCYSSASQGAVAIYKEGSGSSTPSTTPAITLSNIPTGNISAAGDVVTINYQIANPVSGVSVSAAPESGDDWVNTFDYSTDGEISFVVDPKTTTGTRTTTITVSYTGAEDKTFKITQDGATSGNVPVSYTIEWGSSYNGKSVTSYTDTWDATKDGFKVNMANFNNNGNAWSYVKCGRKNNASVATIITDAAITEAISTVTITIDALTAAKINAITLYTSSSKTSGWESAGTFTKATGDQSVTITTPAANKYYKIEFDCASGSSNGLLTLSKAVFSND